MVPEFVERTGGSKWGRALPGAEFGNSNLWFPNSCQNRRQQVEPGPARRRIRELQFMVPEFVERTGGSKWGRALPGAEFGNSNLWFPNSCRNRRQQVAVGPADRQQVGAGLAYLKG